MKYAKSFEKYLKELGAKTPAPGGGSAAGLVLCVGISLFQMALHFSANKNSTALSAAIKRLETIKAKTLPVVDLDGELFLETLQGTESQRTKARQELQTLTFEFASNCIKVFEITKGLRKFVKQIIVSDFCAGMGCVRCALSVSIANLEANRSASDERSVKRMQNLREYLKRVEQWQC